MQLIRDRFTKEELERVVELSLSVGEVVKRLPLREGSDNHRKIAALIQEYGIDTGHFGTKRHKRKLKQDDVFRRFPQCSLSAVKTWAKKYIPYKCTSCGNCGEWQGKPLTLQLNHKDGDTQNCELSNLEYQCPNCHSQTPTYAGRNNKFKMHTIDFSGEVVKKHRQPRLEVLDAYFEFKNE